jgi:hypothetical protein
MCQLVSRVANQRELGFANGGGSFVPHLVGKVTVGGNDINLGTDFLEFGVVVSCIFNFCGTVEGEGCRHENQNRPFTLQALIGDLNEFAVVECLGFERLNVGVDDGHRDSLVGLKKLLNEKNSLKRIITRLRVNPDRLSQ